MDKVVPLFFTQNSGGENEPRETEKMHFSDHEKMVKITLNSRTINSGPRWKLKIDAVAPLKYI